MWNLENKIKNRNTLINTERLIIENRLMVARGEAGRGLGENMKGLGSTN